VIRVRDLEFSYPKGAFAMRVDELACERGGRIALVGPSGSGKTTLLNLLGGVLVPQRGSVSVAGEEVSGRPERWRRAFRLRHVGMIFQAFELLPYLNVIDNVLLPAIVDPSLRTPRIRGRAAHLLDSVGLADKRSRHPALLSQGERQRVAICRALVAEPEVVLADEPTGNLDQENARAALALMLDHVERHGATFVMSTHNTSLLDPFERVVDTAALQGAVS